MIWVQMSALETMVSDCGTISLMTKVAPTEVAFGFSLKYLKLIEIFKRR